MRTIPVGSRDRQNLWILVLLLLTGVWGDNVWEVNYPDPICAIKGSTVTIHCSYKYPEKYHPIRVIWCINHEICKDTTPKIYDSDSTTNLPRFKYIGDKKNNCTLQIENINRDSNTYRFRFETDPKNAFTNQSGVDIKVREIGNNIKLKVTASDDRASKERVTLSCTSSSPCIFNNPKITWYHNNIILPATDIPKPLTAPVMLAVRLTVLAIATAVTLIIVRRLKAKYPNKENRDSVDTPPADPIYINMKETNPSPTGKSRQDVNTLSNEEQLGVTPDLVTNS
ncbi:myelin-associated glycoprotein-like isoform X3 [Osmerus mordax]|uniref:myelin-associated glycoprotein-like isoform X3 n=1 Tax=Osmerus mordax TaxID=8014 RepID=UPI0035107CD8